MKADYEGALEAILEKTRIHGGLPIPIDLARQIVAGIKANGIGGAIVAASNNRPRGVTREQIADFEQLLIRGLGKPGEITSPDDPPKPAGAGALEDLSELELGDLKAMAKDLKVPGWGNMKRETLIESVAAAIDLEEPTE